MGSDGFEKYVKRTENKVRLSMGSEGFEKYVNRRQRL